MGKGTHPLFGRLEIKAAASRGVHAHVMEARLVVVG
jgi:hypothetical protein